MPDTEESKIIHATCISQEGRGVLLLGESGSGKSDLALRMMDRGAALVADDQVQLSKKGQELLAVAPQSLRGRLEVRGIGIMTVAYTPSAGVKLVVQLVRSQLVERMPNPEFFDCLGVRVPLLSLNAFESSIVAKIRLYLKR